jgi:hypothetical protein
MASAAGDIEARHINPGDFMVILCSDPGDSCALALPGLPDAYVFIAKVKKITVKDIVEGGDQDVTIMGHFFFNYTKTITSPLRMQKKTTRMLLETWDIVDVFAGDAEGLMITPENIADIEATMRQIQEHDANTTA